MSRCQDATAPSEPVHEHTPLRQRQTTQALRQDWGGVDLQKLATLARASTPRSPPCHRLVLCSASDTASYPIRGAGDPHRCLLESFVGAAHAPAQHALENERPKRLVGALNDVNLSHPSLPELADDLMRKAKVTHLHQAPQTTNNAHPKIWKWAEGDHAFSFLVSNPILPGNLRRRTPAQSPHLSFAVQPFRPFDSIPGDAAGRLKGSKAETLSSPTASKVTRQRRFWAYFFIIMPPKKEFQLADTDAR